VPTPVRAGFRARLGAPAAPFCRLCGLVYRFRAFPKRGLKIGWPAVLAEETGEGGEFLEVLHAIFGEQVEGIQVPHRIERASQP
jgi:hypothetical protein